MTFPKARLAVSLCLFLGWLGFLGYLVSERNSVILSQPQFAIAQAFVVGKISADDAHVIVEEVLWCADPADDMLMKKGLVLPELLTCGTGQGNLGAGTYLIPLIKRDGVFQIAPVQTPGSERVRSHSHGTLRILDGGEHPERVLQCLVQFAKENPQLAEGLTDPLVVPIVECLLARISVLQVEPRVSLARIDLPRRLPLGGANALAADLKELGAKVEIRKEELRIYPWNSQTKAQLNAIVKAK